MRVLERSRRSRAAALLLAAAGGAAAISLGGCGPSGPLYLPKESSLAAPASGPATAAAVAPSRRPPSATGRGPAAPALASAPFASLPGSAGSAAPSPHRGLVTVPRSAAVFLLRG